MSEGAAEEVAAGKDAGLGRRGDAAISASRVRAILAESDDLTPLEQLLPPTTLAYLKSEQGAEVIRKLKK